MPADTQYSDDRLAAVQVRGQTSPAAPYRTGLPAALAFATFLLGSCATNTTIDVKSAPLGKVGVFSVAGRYLTQQYVGATVFGNERAVVDVVSWKLDDSYGERLARSLRSRTSLDVVVLRPNVDALRPIFDPASLRHVAFDLNPNWGRLEARFREIAHENGVDTLVLLAPLTSGDYFARTNQILEGLGIFAIGRNQPAAKLHLICQVVVISGMTGKPLGHATVSRASSSAMGGPFQRAQPAIEIPGAVARTPYSAMTEAQRQKLRADALAVPLDEALDVTFTDMFAAR